MPAGFQVPSSAAPALVAGPVLTEVPILKQGIDTDIRAEWRWSGAMLTDPEILSVYPGWPRHIAPGPRVLADQAEPGARSASDRCADTVTRDSLTAAIDLHRCQPDDSAANDLALALTWAGRFGTPPDRPFLPGVCTAPGLGPCSP